MKRIRINSGKVGLVFRNGDYLKVLAAGKYWLGLSDKVIMYDMAKAFYPTIELNILLKDEKMASLLHVIEVNDNEIVLQYSDGVFKAVLTAGKYAFWKGLIEYKFVRVDLTKIEISEDIDPLTFKRRELVPFVRVCKVDAFEKGVLFIDNKYERTLDPGEYYFWKNATDVAVSKVDMRQKQMEVSGQEILTRDKAALRVSLMVQYKVIDVEKALINNKDYEKQLYTLMQLALREYIGRLSLDDLMETKDSVSDYVMKTIKAKAYELGVTVSECGLRDIILSGDMKEIMNQVLVAQKKAQANVIMRREETASTRSLLNTAKLMEDNEMLFKLKEMEYVEKIAEKIGEITVTGNGQVINQLKSIFTPGK